MIKNILIKYGLNVDSLIKISSKTYRLITKDDNYILKFHDDSSLESIFARINLVSLPMFLLPIKSLNDNYIETFEDRYYSLTPYLKDETTLAKDLRLGFYVKSLGYLHANTSYNMRVSDGFFNDSLAYLDQLIKECRTLLNSRIEVVEHQEYHSPSDWFFLMNYDHFNKALNEANRYVDNLEDDWKEAKSLHFSLTYQNFNYHHILIKHQKIISLDKMALAPSIYDLIFLFDEAYNSKIDFEYLMKDYLSIHPLEIYEIHWLLAFLFIPKIRRMANDFEDISSINFSLNYLVTVEKMATILLPAT